MYKSRIIITALLLFLTLSAGVEESGAQVDFLFNKNEYIANHPGQLVQTFEAGNVAPGGDQVCGEVVNQFTDDDCFDPGDILPGLQFTTNFVGKLLFLEGEHVGGEGNPRKVLGTQTDSNIELLEIQFPQGGVHTAGIVPGCFDGTPGCEATYLFSVYGEGDVLIDDTKVEVSDRFDTFIGFDSPVPVTKVAISDLNGTTTFEAVDEVRFGRAGVNIPALSEWGMISAVVGLGLIGVFFAVRRRRAVVNS